MRNFLITLTFPFISFSAWSVQCDSRDLESPTNTYRPTVRPYSNPLQTPSTQQIAARLRSFFPEVTEPFAIDAFGGSGQMTWALAQQGFTTKTFESDSARQDVLRNNIIHSGARGVELTRFGFTPAELQRFSQNKTTVHALYLAQAAASEFDSLIRQTIDRATVVAVKLPASIDLRHIHRLAQTLARTRNLEVVVEFQDLEGSEASPNQTIAYFVHRAGDPSLQIEVTRVVIPRGSLR